MARDAMDVADASKLSRRGYKITIGILKILPMTMAGLCLLNTVLSYFDIDCPSISYLSGIGFIPWLFIYAAACQFRFCNYHKMFLWYVFANDLLCWIDYKWTLPISDRNLFIIHIIVAGTFMFLALYYHQKCKKNFTKKLKT